MICVSNRLYMKKLVVKSAVAVLVAVVVWVGGKIYESVKRDSYKQQLEYTLDDICLEGNDIIGAFDTSLCFDSLTVHKVSDFDYSELSWMWINYGISWGGATYSDHKRIISEAMLSGKYNWYDFRDCTTVCQPFIIIVKKTLRGYDLIGEFLLGIGLTKLYPNSLISHTSHIYNCDWDLTVKDSVRNPKKRRLEVHEYKVKADMLNSYFNDIVEKRYQGVSVNNVGSIGGKNRKFELLDGLAMKGVCPVDSSLYFRVNKYFELKYDNEILKTGNDPIVYQYWKYEMPCYTIFTETVTMHYSIQENKDVLENECNKKIVLWMAILEAFYFLLIVWKRKNSNCQ